jgi:hypothetical protein
MGMSNYGVSGEHTPPHLRVQHQQPFVRPVSGMEHAYLGSVYKEIGHWRSQFKALNAEIIALQEEAFQDIARMLIFSISSAY